MSRAGFAPRLDRTIDSSSRAPAEARRAVEELGTDFDLTDPSDVAMLRDIQLLVSELVTNSVRHAGSDAPIRIRAWARQGGIHVEVADGGLGFDAQALHSPDFSESGRGLLILESLTDRWGVSRDGATRVWFEIARRGTSDGRARAAS